MVRYMEADKLDLLVVSLHFGRFFVNLCLIQELHIRTVNDVYETIKY